MMGQLAVTLGLAGAGLAQPPVPTEAKPYPVVADIDFAEGPIFDARGNLYFVDYIRNGTIGVKTTDGAVSILCETGGRANGLKIDAEGYLIAADYEGRRILRISPDGTDVRTLASECNGKPFLGPNDVCLDQAGNVYMTQCEGSSKEEPTGVVYRISPDGGEVIEVAGGMAYPNGLAVSPDQRRLFVSESGENRVIAFDLQPDGRGTNRQVVHQFPDDTADGLMFDEFGRLWVARWTHGTLDVISQTGELLGSLDAGGTQVTNLCWWGTQLYVTVAGEHSIHRFEVGCRAAPQIPSTADR
jgi:gluconolactonase